MSSARNRELLGLIPATLLVTAGFAAVFVQEHAVRPNASLTYGAVFLGRHTPEAIGDYVGGPNHVLPTARSARFSSGLSVLDFVKRTSILKLGPEQLRALAAPAITLAEAEGLAGHAHSIAIRLNRRD